MTIQHASSWRGNPRRHPFPSEPTDWAEPAPAFWWMRSPPVQIGAFVLIIILGICLMVWALAGYAVDTVIHSRTVGTALGVGLLVLAIIVAGKVVG